MSNNATQSDLSWMPITLGFFNAVTFFAALCWGLWICQALVKLKQFQMNPVTQALLLTIGGAIFGFIQTLTETLQMCINDIDLHLAFYRPPGINSICLSGIGACMVLSDFAIPLLWLQVSGSES